MIRPIEGNNLREIRRDIRERALASRYAGSRGSFYVDNKETGRRVVYGYITETGQVRYNTEYYR
jgi:hypothetical protein